MASSILAATLATTAPLSPLRMVALDMDGTLLNRHHQPSAAALDTLRVLHRAGVVVVLCSGRSQAAMYPCARELGLPELPLVCFNGALGLRCSAAFLNGDEASPVVLFQTPVPADAARRVLSHAAARGELVQVSLQL